MSIADLEQRMLDLEAEVAQLKENHSDKLPERERPWWEAIWGTAKDDPIYEHAMELGRAYRKAQPPPDADDDP